VTVLLALMLTLLGASGLITVLIGEPVHQALALAVLGLLEALMFYAVQAPDVARSQIVVSGIALPAMLCLAIAKVHAEQRAQAAARAREQQDEEE
jgi:energy-converting hydrogenase B subunit D